MKIGRNEPCPCGSGKKYKKCCIDKKVNENLNNAIETIEFKNNELNDKLEYLYDNFPDLNEKERVDIFLLIMNYILDYAEDNNIHDPENLDKEYLINGYIYDIIQDLELDLENLDKDSYDFDVIFNYLDRVVKVFDLDDNVYEWQKRCKTHLLFKLGNYELGEKIMLDLIEEKNNSIYPYVQLVDDFEMVGLLDKAKYYYVLGMTKTNFEDLDVLEERKDYFER